ncbi:MAG: DUF362 domain-containing protein [Firmicutes bacterium]|nr:DUF362 domain-containing protein [Candidatus Colivicinus equi]
MKTRVYVRHLESEYQKESRTKFLPLSSEMSSEIKKIVYEILDNAGGEKLLKASKNVYIKPNGIDGKAYCFTRPELVEAVIDYFKSHGANKIYLFENSTQSNFTRLVFELTGYAKICRKTGAIPVYLDEDEGRIFEFKGKDDYESNKFEMPNFVIKNLIEDKDKNLYISLPKLKTHSMAGVTLGVKNQWAFPRQSDRGYDHNHSLGYKLVDVLSYVRPDFTIIEGVEGTIYGHYPVTALADKAVLPLKLIIAGNNVVATDMIGAKVFGLGLEDVSHLRLAVEKDLADGVKSYDDIEVDGDISMYNTKYPTDLYDAYPNDVRRIFGKTMACKEGCVNNPMTLLQVLYNDHHGKGGWTMVMGKGFDKDEIDSITGKVLVVGHCAIEEVGDYLVKKLGKKNVFFSGKCNELAKSAAAMFNLMKVSPLEFAPISPLVSIKCIVLAKLHGTKALVPSLISNYFKTV